MVMLQNNRKLDHQIYFKKGNKMVIILIFKKLRLLELKKKNHFFYHVKNFNFF
jgi:hypothetical protein